MNWFTKIFSNRQNERTATPGQPSGLQQATHQTFAPSVTADLFVDNQAPEAEREAAKESIGMIRAFLEQDFFGTGYKDGYNYHSTDMMNNRIKAIKAGFRFKLDQFIEDKRIELLQLRTHNIEFEGLSERMTKRIEAVEEDQRLMIARLEREKELSVEDEGWIMKPIHEYRDGFLRGAEAYTGEKLLAGSTGLFNL